MEPPETFPPGSRPQNGCHPPPLNWYDTLDRNNTNVSLNSKGLRNAPGENNCFLNSAVQVFWHLDVFRRSYRRLSGHLCMGNSCIFCALKVIFTQFQYSDQASLPPDALRKALADSFMNQQRFQLGHMDDAAECFENILRRIHFHIANAYSEDSCSASHCLAHQKFAMRVFDQLVCVCGASSEPFKFHEMVHYINTNALVSQYRSMQETGDLLHPDRFGLLLRNGGAAGDLRDCPNNCGKRVQIRRTLLNTPDVVSIGLVWDSDRPDSNLITDVARSIGTTILLQDVFHSVMCKDVTKLPRLQLSALVCYYGKHYSTFVYDTKSSIWKYFDDATVKEIGPKWEHVVDKCSRGHYQPLLLLYTNPNANPISTDTAPKKRVMAPGYGTPSKGGSEKENRSEGGKKSRSKSSIVSENLEQIDSVLPNPDQISPDVECPKPTNSEHRRQPSFLIAITGKNGKKSEYAVPNNIQNGQIKQPLPGGQGPVKSGDRSYYHDNRNGPNRGYVQKDMIEEDGVDGYTLSTSDQYRRPSLNTPPDVGLSNFQLNVFNRVTEIQRKESLKKGKDKVRADVIRYQVDPQRSSSSDSDSQGTSEHSHEAITPPALPPKKFHHSQSFEDSPANLSADHIDVRQHVVMKPKPGNYSHDYENIENLIHTPVQSGLATLPRNKKAQNRGNTGHHSRQNSINGENNMKQSSSSHSRQSSTNTLTESCHSRQSSTNTLTDHSRQNSAISQHSDSSRSLSSHGQNSELSSRQSSSVSQHSEIINQANSQHIYQMSSSQYQRQKSAPSHLTNSTSTKSSENQRKEKPPKPVKPDKKPSSQKKKPNLSQLEQTPPPLPDKKNPPSPGGGGVYIDRKIVESVLNYQTKLSRQGSTNSNISQASHSSNTSFDSDYYVKPGKEDTQFDNLSLESHRDSGYGSSDRNSSSSTGSSTLDPYTQYFLSKSMIPPKTFNQQAAAENMKKLVDPNYQWDNSQTIMSQYGHQNSPTNSSANNGGHKNAPYVNYPVQSETVKPFQPIVDGFGNPVDQSKQLYDPAIVRSHQGKDVPVHPYSGQTGHNSAHSTENSVVNPKEGIPSITDQFMMIYHQSEELMDQCVLAETDENYPDAIRYCTNAIDCLRQAMKISNLPHQSYTYGQRKHNSCLLKLRSLQKKSAIMRQESNSSTTSSDSARSSPLIVNSPYYPEDCPNHHGKQMDHCINQSVSQLQQNAVHSRSSSRDSIDSVIENKNYRGDRPSSVNSSQKLVNSSISSQNNNERTLNSTSDRTKGNNSNSVDLYGTLPRKNSKKPPSKSSVITNSSQDPEVYRDFLNRQVAMSGNPNQGSRSSTPNPLENHSSDKKTDSQYQMQMPSQHQVITNIAEIRPLNQNNGPIRAIHSQKNCPQNSSVPHNTPEVCNNSQQQTAKAHPVLPPKPGRTTDPGSNLPPKPNGTSGQHQKTTTYKAGKPAIAPSISNSAVQYNSATLSYSRRNISRHASFSQPHASGSSVFATQTLERYASQPDCQRLTSPFFQPDTTESANVIPWKDDNNVAVQQPALGEPYASKTVPVHSSSRPTTPQPESSNSTETDVRPSVRDLASRFGGVTTSNNQPAKSNPRVQPPNPPPQGLANRQRSKSESDFRNMQEVKPRSVLSKSKKHKGGAPRKSVTFCDNIALISAADLDEFGFVRNPEELHAGYVSDEEDKFGFSSRSAFSDNEIEEGDSSDSPVEIYAGEEACNLCGKKGVVPGYFLCSKCQMYMSRFQQRT